ncbi:MAG: 3-isopropylmalate dehydrogenase [Chloroflexi bacterium]|jgi:3-isopropylmalate dehydrogenase|nr:MAG: 3-isopropylmalate dehydrogenase [Chloroflexota bacterium]
MDMVVVVLPGDGIGPEVVAQGVKVLVTVAEKFGHALKTTQADIGGLAIDKHGTPLPETTLNLCQGSSAVLLGAVGGPKWDDPSAQFRPEDGLLQLRKGLGLFANLRPVKVFPAMADSSTLKPEVLDGVDLMVVRELTGGIYFGKPKRRWETNRGRRAVDTLAYTEREIERILRVGFELARGRRKHLTSVDKANVLETSRLWRQIANELAEEYTDVTLDHLYVDNCAMQLVLRPSHFDVLVSENMFGDILSDEAAILSGSLGLLSSASLARIPSTEGRRRRRTMGLYEPVHGSAPDIAGTGKANPIATILSVALMLRYSFNLHKEAGLVEQAVASVIEAGYRTADIAVDGQKPVNTTQMGQAILEAL